MNPPNQQQRRPFDRQRTIDIVMECSKTQSTPQNRENYFNSCEAHGGDLAEIVKEIRKNYIDTNNSFDNLPI